MKNFQVTILLSILRPYGLGLIITMASFTALQANLTLTDGDASFTLNTTTDYGISNWVLSADELDQSYRQWLFFRKEGFNREFEFGAPDLEYTVGNSVGKLEWNDVGGEGLFSAVWTITLEDGVDSTCSLTSSLEITSLSSDDFICHIYMYTDLDLDGSAANESIDWISSEIIRQDDATTSTYVEIAGVDHDRWEVGNYSALYDKLRDTDIDDLTNDGAPYVGDAGNVFQWTRTLSLGEVFTMEGGFAANTGFADPCPGCTVSPVLDLGSYLVESTETNISIVGNHFTPGGLAEINLSGNGLSDIVTVDVSAYGSFTYDYELGADITAGIYHVRAVDVLTDAHTISRQFVKQSDPPLALRMTKNFSGNEYTENEIFTVTWSDRMEPGHSAGISPDGDRYYEYAVRVSWDGGSTWSEPNVVPGQSPLIEGKYPVEEILHMSHLVSIPVLSSEAMVRVFDVYEPDRFVVSDTFSILSMAGSSTVDIRRSLDHSWPSDLALGVATIGGPKGVAADGTSRIILTLENTQASMAISSMTLSLADQDGGHGSTTAMLGKLMRATVTDSYSDEANAAVASSLTIVNDDNEDLFHIWYVAPDDFNQNFGTYNTRSSRDVTCEIDISYTDGSTEMLSVPIEIVRPPVVLLHGFGTGSEIWEELRYDDGEDLLTSDRFTIVHPIDVSSKQSLSHSAEQILNKAFAHAPKQNDLLVMETNSVHKAIYDMRRLGYACNRVDVIGFSFGGSIAREAQSLPMYLSNSASGEQYNNYLDGYFHKYISINTPHLGTPLADLFTDWIDRLSDVIPTASGSNWDLALRLTEFLGEEALCYFMASNPDNFMSEFLAEECRLQGFPNYSEPVPTDAILDLRLRDGLEYGPTLAPSHAIATDWISGSIPDYSEAFESAIGFTEDFVEIGQRLMDHISLKYEPSPGQLATMPAAERQFWNDLRAIKDGVGTGVDVADEILQWLELFMTVYTVTDFILDSDGMVHLDSQVSGLSPSVDHVTVFNGPAHLHPWSPLSSWQVGNHVIDLLNAGESSSSFGSLSSTYDNIKKRASSETRTSGELLPDDIFISREVGLLSAALEIVEPDVLSEINLGANVDISVAVHDTLGLDHVSIYFQDQSFYFDAPFSDTLTVRIQANSSVLDTSAVEVIGVYQYFQSLGVDSTAYSYDYRDVVVESSSPLLDFAVTPRSYDMVVGDRVQPDYQAIYSDYFVQIGAFNPELEVSIVDTFVVRFNRMTAQFEAVCKGRTSASVIYRQDTGTIYFTVRELDFCKDREVLYDLSISDDVEVRAGRRIQLIDVAVDSGASLSLTASEIDISPCSEVALTASLHMELIDGCLGGSDAWSEEESFPAAVRREMIEFAVVDHVFVGNPNTRDFYKFDPSCGHWIQLQDLPSFFNRCPSFVIDELVYIVRDTHLWRYDPAGDEWMQLSDVPGENRVAAFGFSIDGVGYIGGGFYNAEEFWSYDVATDSWTQLGDLPVMTVTGSYPVDGKSFVIDDQAYVTGTNTRFWRYDPSDDTWVQRAYLYATYPAAVQLDGRGFVMTAQGNLYEYHTDSNSWSLYAEEYTGQLVCSPIGQVADGRAYFGVSSIFTANTCTLTPTPIMWSFLPMD